MKVEIVKTVKLSSKALDQLNQLKRKTKIKQWNILCRWALCRSLAESSIPSPVPIKTDSKVEIAWHVFGGAMADILAIAIKQRCYQDGLGTEPNILKQQFELHLHRGIGYLAGDTSINSIEDFLNVVSQ